MDISNQDNARLIVRAPVRGRVSLFARFVQLLRNVPLAVLSTKLISLLSFFVLWSLGSSYFGNDLFLPYPWTVAAKLYDLVVYESFFMHAANTVGRVFVGFALALILGSAMGIAMGLRQRIEEFLDLYVLIGLTIPGLAWSVLAVMWFGISEAAPVFAIVMVTAPMLAVNMWQGTKAIDRQLLEMAQAFCIGRGRVITGIVVPHLAPYLLAATRFGFGLGWKVVVLSEIFGMSNGIGYMINRSFSRFSMVDVLAWTFGFTVIMFVLEYGLLQPLERYILRWRPKFTL
jgi:NitT/TauT family transport system permease protein